MKSSTWAALVMLLGLLAWTGCEGDVNRPDNKPSVEVKQRPDLDPSTDHDVDVKLPDVDVNVNKEPGKAPDVDVDVMEPADKDTQANENEPAGVDR